MDENMIGAVTSETLSLRCPMCGDLRPVPIRVTWDLDTSNGRKTTAVVAPDGGAPHSCYPGAPS